jgi:hypothetical protein
MENERLAVVEQQLSQLPELQSDVKEILKQVGDIKLSVATLPTWEAIKPAQVKQEAENAALALRVTALETQASQFTAGAKTVVFLGTCFGVLIGWAVSWFHK